MQSNLDKILIHSFLNFLKTNGFELYSKHGRIEEYKLENLFNEWQKELEEMTK